ncbi:MAG: hypothetical protein LUD81_03750, partial [Clostridiales bacterium]|nr:hypothetical protein [Clostridiales bacterium]
ILAAALFVLSMIDEDKMGSSIAAITGLFADLVASITLLEKFNGSSGKGLLNGIEGVFSGTIDATRMIAMAGAIVILAGALKIIAGIDPDKLEGAFMAITGLMVNMTAFMKIMENGGSKSVKGATQMVIFAAALKVLASVCKDLSELKPEEIATGLIGVGVLLGEVAAFLKLGNFGSSSVSAGARIVILAEAIKILASACEIFSKMNLEQIAKGLTGVGALLVEVGAFTKLTSDSKHMLTSGAALIETAAAIKIIASAFNDIKELNIEQIATGLTGIGGLLTEISAFTKLTSSSKHMLTTGAALIEIAAAMKIIASVFNDMKDMTWEEMVRGLTAMGVALAEITAAVNLMPKNMLSIGSGLLIVSAALLVLSKALENMGYMSGEEIAKSLIALGGAMAILAVGLNVMKGTLGGSAAMTVAVAALALLVSVLYALGSMSWETIAKGLIVMASAFAIIGVAGLALSPLTPIILAFSAAFGIMSVSMAIFSASVALLAASIGALATGASTLVATLKTITAGASLSGSILPALLAGLEALIATIAGKILEYAPKIIAVVSTLIIQVLESLAEYAPQIVNSLCDFLIGVFDALAERIPELASSIGNVLKAIFEVFQNAIGDMSGEEILELIAGVGMITALMFALSALSGIVPSAMVGVLALGVLIAELAAVGALAQIPGLEWLISEGGNLLEKIGTALGQFVGGLVGGIASGITGQLPGMAQDLSLFMANLQPFIIGAKMIDASSMDGIKALAEALIMLTASELLNGITSWLTGGASLADFGEELNAFAPSFTSFANTVSGTDFSNVAVSAEALRDFCDAASDIPNQGGLVSLFTGDNTLGKFADGLAAFGINWAAYARLVQGVDFSGVAPSAEALSDFCDAASDIPNSGGLVGLFSGENDLTDFGSGLQSFGKNLKQYAEDVSGIDNTFVTNMSNAANALTVFAEAAESTNSGKDLKTFGKKLEAFGTSFVTFCNSMNSANFDSSSVSSAANALSSIVDSAATAAQNKLETFTTIGKNIVDKLKSGITSNKTSAVTAIGNIAKQMITKVKGYYESFRSAGSYLASGLAAGITAGKSSAITAAGNMARETLQAAKDELEIASPSQAFRDEVGKQIGAGLAEGILASTDEAAEAASNMSDEVIKAAKSKLSNFKDWISDLKFYGNITTEEKLFAYEEIAEQFKDIPELYKECNKEIYTLQNELTEEEKKRMEDNYQAALNYVEREKNFNRMSAAEEIAYLQNVYDNEKLTEEDREELEEKLFAKRQEYIEGNAELIKQEIDRETALLETYEQGSEEYANTVLYLTQLIEDYAEAVEKANEELAEANTTELRTLFRTNRISAE